MGESKSRPGEYLEALEKKEERERALPEAKFYRSFLDIFKNKISERTSILRRSKGDDINTMKLKEFEFWNLESARMVSDAVRDANDAAKTQVKPAPVDRNELGEKTLQEFYSYIEELKASLLK